jgi:hypothetical protein
LVKALFNFENMESHGDWLSQYFVS